MSTEYKIYAPKLKHGDHVRVIAPSRSLKIIGEDTQKIAIERLKKFGFQISFSEFANSLDEWGSSTQKQRLEDLHTAFSDKSVNAIFTAIGGFNVNELLNHIDYDLIKENPKILCGFSDITALSNAIYTKTGLVGYSGPHFSSWGMKKGFDYTEDYFHKCLMEDKPYDVFSSTKWSDEPWYIDQENRTFIPNTGYEIINGVDKETEIKGTVIGGNLGLLNILQGTPYFPSLENSILFLEHCSDENNILFFNRGIQSLAHLDAFKGVKAIILGRFQKSEIPSFNQLKAIFQTKPEFKNIPVISGADFGHTTPIFTFPVGGEANICISAEKNIKIKILRA